MKKEIETGDKIWIKHGFRCCEAEILSTPCDSGAVKYRIPFDGDKISWFAKITGYYFVDVETKEAFIKRIKTTNMPPFKQKEQKDPFADKTKCEECKHWVDKSDCQEVRLVDYDWGYISSTYYCSEHKKPYDRVFIKEDFSKKYTKNIPAHQIEVDIKGKEIKK